MLPAWIVLEGACCIDQFCNTLIHDMEGSSPLLWHVTWVTYGSRVSERMIRYDVPRVDGLWLEPEDEVTVTDCISAIVRSYHYQVHEYSICGDHVHMIVSARKEELANIVKTIKSLSARKYKEAVGVPPEHTFHLWAQKFNRRQISDSGDMETVKSYIKKNREKHGLAENKAILNLVAGMISPINLANE